MKEEVRGKRVKEAVAFASVEVFLGFEAVVFGEDRSQRDLDHRIS